MERISFKYLVHARSALATRAVNKRKADRAYGIQSSMLEGLVYYCPKLKYRKNS